MYLPCIRNVFAVHTQCICRAYAMYLRAYAMCLPHIRNVFSCMHNLFSCTRVVFSRVLKCLRCIRAHMQRPFIVHARPAYGPWHGTCFVLYGDERTPRRFDCREPLFWSLIITRLFELPSSGRGLRACGDVGKFWRAGSVVMKRTSLALTRYLNRFVATYSPHLHVHAPPRMG